MQQNSSYHTSCVLCIRMRGRVLKSTCVSLGLYNYIMGLLNTYLSSDMIKLIPAIYSGA